LVKAIRDYVVSSEVRIREIAMTGAKLREAMDLLRNLKQQYPAESDELLQQRLREKLGCDPAMRRAIIEDI
jgi:hypothetical protein